MEKYAKNIKPYGLSEKTGDLLVFCQVDGQTVVLGIYTITKNNENLDGNKIIVTASGLPGNVSCEKLRIEYTHSTVTVQDEYRNSIKRV
jgi:hypothetical protein